MAVTLSTVMGCSYLPLNHDRFARPNVDFLVDSEEVEVAGVQQDKSGSRTGCCQQAGESQDEVLYSHRNGPRASSISSTGADILIRSGMSNSASRPKQNSSG